jgi:glycolate oxidase FAD binding subunit
LQISTPREPAELAELLARNAAGERMPVFPRGGGRGWGFGGMRPDDGLVVETSALARTIDYPARDMTVTVEAGTRIASLAALLQTERQRLPVDVPFPQEATVGGVLATNASGPLRYGMGTLRDALIGVAAVDAQGKTFHAGGRVVKNVAGYDLCKLLVGSLGALGVISAATFKLRPLPDAAGWLWCRFVRMDDVERALAGLLQSAARPVAVDLADAAVAQDLARGIDGIGGTDAAAVLLVGIEGTAREVEWQQETLRNELAGWGAAAVDVLNGTAAATLHQRLTEWPHDAPPENGIVFKAGLPPGRTVEFANQARHRGVGVLARAGNGVVYGRLPEECLAPHRAAALLAPLLGVVADARGHLSLLRCPDGAKPHLPLWGAPHDSWLWMQRLKEKLDPNRLLNRGVATFAEPAAVP